MNSLIDRLQACPAVKLVVLLLAIVILCPAGYAQNDRSLRVLPDDFSADKSNQMMRAYQRKLVHRALDQRLDELEQALDSQEAMANYQAKRRQFLRWTLGPMPEPAALNAKVTGKIDEDGFWIENILFQSQPGFHVTANLYRPDGSGPFPGVLLPCGHAANGKAYAAYQKASRLLVRHGFVVLCFDPIGQGERRQLIDADPHPIQPKSEHNDLGVAPILLGGNLASYMVWDGIRGIDYLCSRPDVDAARIGCTGNSGGGNLTSYLMAYDDRIVAAAPGCFMTTHRRKNEIPGPGDAEQNLFAQIRDGFDHPDFAIVRAPKPTLILAATHDYVPIEGTWKAFRQAKRVYTRLGYPERIDLVETNDKHGFSRRLREGVVRFFARWLQGRQVEVLEDDQVRTLSDSQLQVTPRGQLRWMEGERTVFDLFAESERELAKTRPQLTDDLVRRITGIRSLDSLPAPRVERVSEGDHANRLPSRLIIHPEPHIVLPALHWPGGHLAPILVARDNGMNAGVANARKWHAEGHPVLLIDVRDIGETKTRNWRYYGADSMIGQMLGRSWLAMRAEDLMISARWLSDTEQNAAVRLSASGEVGPAALHAAFLAPDLIERLSVENGLRSWRELMTSRSAHRHIHQAVRGVLRFYDLPDLKAEIQSTDSGIPTGDSR